MVDFVRAVAFSSLDDAFKLRATASLTFGCFVCILRLFSKFHSGGWSAKWCRVFEDIENSWRGGLRKRDRGVFTGNWSYLVWFFYNFNPIRILLAFSTNILPCSSSWKKKLISSYLVLVPLINDASSHNSLLLPLLLLRYMYYSLQNLFP